MDRIDFLGYPVTMLLEDDRNGALYACLTLGHFGCKLHRSDDGGVHWRELAVPVYPSGAVIAAPPIDESTPPSSKPASLSEIWALETTGDTQGESLWAGTIPGGLFRSDDAGESWHLNEPLWNRAERMDWFGGGKDDPGIHSICVDPRDANHVTLGVSCGGIWETRNAGESWELIGEGLRAEFMPPDAQFKQSIQDAHRLAQCNANPDVMWVQHHNGIFHSVDGSASYREIDQAGPSTFGFAVCAHPDDDKTAWFVPAIKDECRVPADGQLVVTRTRDGGETFQTLRSGLPQQHCYDIVFRHGLDIDASGEQLAMGSSTGGLWISDNQGDDWTSISNTLPQIYVVRFSGRI
ncbi:MAG: exo-alpha-sialidase [Pirellulaceae bacterium]|nr:exo-alpha-sialidase [Pirellulaceae bacterium]